MHRDLRSARLISLLVAVATSPFLLAQGSAFAATVTAAMGTVVVAWPLVLAGAAVSLVAMVNRGLVNRATHRSLGLEATARPMTRTSAAGFAANKMVRSGGLGGLAIFVRHGRRYGFDAARIAAACTLAAVASFAALGVVMMLTIVVLVATGQMTGWLTFAAVGFAIYAIAVAGALYEIARHPEGGDRILQRSRRLHARVRRQPQPVASDKVSTLLTAARIAARSRWMYTALGHALVSKALGALMLLIAAGAAGADVSVAAIIVIYTTALASSAAVPVPGGLGVVETSTAAMLVAAGAPLATAGTAVALFRVFDLWIPLLGGAAVLRTPSETRTDAKASIVQQRS